jgi:hypothetical protein
MIFDLSVRKLIKRIQNASNNETVIGLCNIQGAAKVAFPKRKLTLFVRTTSLLENSKVKTYR